MDTLVLPPDPEGIAQASNLLDAGELVAFPTDTVYGLGAKARSDAAVAKVFDAKGRPTFNPLIIHVADVEMADSIALIDGPARDLIKRVWPEPLSIVVPLRENAELSPLVTAGQSSVAIRMPKSPIAQALITAFDGPVAAPSANPSGQVSPTAVSHVLAGLNGKIAAILDGGPCEAGIESTVISFLDDTPKLLREGAYLPDFPTYTEPAEGYGPLLAPGRLASHYAPNGQMRLNATTATEDEFHIGFGDIAGDMSLSERGDLMEAAAALYSALHEANRCNAKLIAVAPVPEEGLGRAINDRLRRAAAPRD